MLKQHRYKRAQTSLLGILFIFSILVSSLLVLTEPQASAAGPADRYCNNVFGSDYAKVQACRAGYDKGYYGACYVAQFIACSKGVEGSSTAESPQHKSPFDIGCTQTNASVFLSCFTGYSAANNKEVNRDDFCTKMAEASAHKNNKAAAIASCKAGWEKNPNKTTPSTTTTPSGGSSAGSSNTAGASGSSSGSTTTIAGENAPDPINQLDRSLGGDEVPKLASKDVLLPNESATSTSIVSDVLKIIFSIAGALAFLVMVIAGLRYIAAAGDPQKTAQAKNTIIYALIGLIVAISAQAIVVLVVRAL